MFSGTCCFYGSVKSQQVRLVCNACDQVHYFAYLAGLLIQLFDHFSSFSLSFLDVSHFSYQFTGSFAHYLDHFVGLSCRFCCFLGIGCNLLNGLGHVNHCPGYIRGLSGLILSALRDLSHGFSYLI